MKKTIWFCFLAGSLLMAIPSSVMSYQQAPKLTINELITLNAEKYQVSPKTLHKVIKCESKYNPKAIGDGGHSYGLVQIHLPSHPEITKVQALNQEFAIEYLAKSLALGKGRMWTCYRILT